MRLNVEDLLGGRRVEIDGDHAQALADDLARVLGTELVAADAQLGGELRGVATPDRDSE